MPVWQVVLRHLPACGASFACLPRCSDIGGSRCQWHLSKKAKPGTGGRPSTAKVALIRSLPTLIAVASAQSPHRKGQWGCARLKGKENDAALLPNEGVSAI